MNELVLMSRIHLHHLHLVKIPFGMDPLVKLVNIVCAGLYDFFRD